MAAPAQLRFVNDATELGEFLLRLKLIACPHCGAAETLNAHGPLRGYVECGSELVVRGWRIYCANRGLRKGCGRTFSALLAGVLWGFVVRAATLLEFVLGVLGGESREAVWRRCAPSYSLGSGYRLWKRVSQQQPQLRSRLYQRAPPVQSEAHEPLQAVVLHLQVALPDADALFAGFQYDFQASLLG